MATHDHEDVLRRLRSLGSQPVQQDLADSHVSYLAAATPAAAARSRLRPLFAGALLAGAVLGGSGLAAALPGSLPEQAGSVAKSALAAVNLADDKEASPADKAAKEAAKAAKVAAHAAKRNATRFTAGCTAGTPPIAFTGNHGQYVKLHPDDPATANVNEREVAAQSDCGKPLTSIGADDATDNDKAAKKEKAEKDKADKADGTEEDGKAGEPDDASEPADAGRPESPGKSEDDHPPTTADKERGSENRTTDKGKAGDAGEADEHRPDGVGPPTSAG